MLNRRRFSRQRLRSCGAATRSGCLTVETIYEDRIADHRHDLDQVGAVVRRVGRPAAQQEADATHYRSYLIQITPTIDDTIFVDGFDGQTP